jgi:TRAP-type C4-dicarboxylate transport system permease small subunit
VDTITRVLKKISDGVEKAGFFISTLYCVTVFLLVFSGVFLRVIGKSLSWSEELARWLLISMAFVSSSVAMKRGMHVGITLLVKMLPKLLMKAVIFFSNGIVMIFLWYGFIMSFRAALGARDQMGDVILIPMMYVKLNLTLGFLMMMIHLVYISCALLKSDAPEKLMISS